jgi:AhpD family alkylhydroperoxidase
MPGTWNFISKLKQMENRVNIQKIQPAAYNVLVELEKQMMNSSIEHTIRELIKIRVSQINGCAFCIDMHTRDAREHGETEQRIYGLSAWRDTPFYSQKERAALALAEEVTMISQGGVSTKTYSEAAAFYSEEELAMLILAAVTINSWNRIAISTHLQPKQQAAAVA